MMIDRISGAPSGAPSAQRADNGESSNFNRVLSKTASALSENAQAPDIRTGTLSDTSSRKLQATEAVKIGTISSKNPTVSDLLIQNPALGKDTWNIICSRQNRDKAYTRIQDGTDIYYNPATRELLWGDMVERGQTQPALASASPEPVAQPGKIAPSSVKTERAALSSAAESGTGVDGLNGSLADAVQPMIGKSYSDMNCYELLVNGLSRMGVRYYGRDGLANRMMTGAVDRGLPMNAYLNGEGLIRFSGSETYRKTLMRVSDPAGQARQVIDEITAHLEKGSILSFSTESRGHAGIVSNKNGAWTYINSGVMDNSVDAVHASRGVGEERLEKEIENWFQLAARRNESLVITLGKLNQNKLAAYGAGKGQRAGEKSA